MSQQEKKTSPNDEFLLGLRVCMNDENANHGLSQAVSKRQDCVIHPGIRSTRAQPCDAALIRYTGVNNTQANEPISERARLNRFFFTGLFKLVRAAE